MQEKYHTVDLCVVGGGLAGMCTAISAARRGASVALMHDRPVLGGNASSEIRMHVCGAHGDNLKATGIIEEIELENLYRNTYPSYSVWDSVLFEKVKFEDNIKLLLNCSCMEAETEGDTIQSVTGWQLTTETTHTVKARFFADCSGDGILGPLTGAEFRIGREARDEFNESIAPEKSDRKTMGMSCLFQVRETDSPKKFIPPSWAHVYETDDEVRRHHEFKKTNFWWIELGGEDDSIHDTEDLRDELLKIVFGVWDHIKNRGDHGAENWLIDWIGFLPGKRESRRFIGDHIMTQNEVEAEGKFDDLIAYGGWSMDDHFPAGFNHPEGGTIFHPAPSPYGIPYRSLYSRNMNNLFFAGRNISVTHSAMSSTRVMATCALIGQAAGTAASIAVQENCSPRGVYEQHIDKLKQRLMDDDCYLPWNSRSVDSRCLEAELEASGGDPENLRNGVDRKTGDEQNSWEASPGDWVSYTFREPVSMNGIRLVFDSNLNRGMKNMPYAVPKEGIEFAPPETLVKSFTLEMEEEDGAVKTVSFENSYQRLVRVPLKGKAVSLKLTVNETWGCDQVHVFGFEIY